MDSILEMDIAESSFTAGDYSILLSIFGKSIEYFIREFISYKGSDRDLQNQIICI
jgi:hypothetical protein